ncbi:sulfate/molybdate ABC transporter ATP-binding protein [Pararhodospirillum photometricum]|uniref:Sulphate transport system permease protein 1 n=1 Tax=Pararhodospirillum photometricum DSM 122 TaxID=1150469 RepID=H6SRB4_PARPM|nr:sulfate/molybdate ABC transporter ATP-binding protein [Pararhodospirillum photometricum]CCG09836.1 Sulphate transport system permease protein 1 [Pararhodospirillum photometricum DSM 122]
MQIDIESISKDYGDFPALREVSLSINAGELVALLGPSGSGKTTLLRVIAGLEQPRAGRILFAGQDINNTPVQHRNVGFVFQHYALFRHMSVLDNIAFGLKVRKLPKAARRARALELLSLVQLEGLHDRFPAQLSGGQRQRVALARALAIDPAVLLLDEPFGALDAKVRKDLRRWLRALHDETGHTTVFVTHDQEEALELADRVVVMRDGRIEQIGTPEDLCLRPATPFVYGFLGDTNVVPVEIRAGAAWVSGHPAPILTGLNAADGPARLYVRPHDFRFSDQPVGAIPGVVLAIRRRLDALRVEVGMEGHHSPLEVALPLPCPDAPDPGQRVLLAPVAHGLFAGERSIFSEYEG